MESQGNIYKEKNIDRILSAMGSLYMRYPSAHDFFRVFVSSLATALNAKFVFVTELRPDTPGRVHMKAFWKGTSFSKPYSYILKGTACEKVINENSFYHYPHKVQQLFPHDEKLKRLNADSYVGVPILNRRRKVVGHIAILHDKALILGDHDKLILSIFAARAGIEFDYLQHLR